MQRVLKLFIFFYIFSGWVSLLDCQVIRIKRMSLKAFPRIEALISIESDIGTPIPVNTGGLELYENGRRIKDIRAVPLDSRQFPIYTVIIIDKSGSMKGVPIERAKEAAGKFVNMMRGEDRVAYIEFDTRIKVISNFTKDATLLINKIKKTRPGSDTALLDAVWQGVKLFQPLPANGARVILVLTDGMENRSTRSLTEVIQAARQQEVSIFTVGLGKKIDRRMLEQMAAKTEANFYHAPAPDRLGEIYRNISRLLHSQLLVYFKTPFPMDDQWHRLQFRMPFRDKTISGEKLYLSAEESKIPTPTLRQIREQEKKRAMERQQLTESRVKRDSRLILILSLILVMLLLVLAAVLIHRGRGKRRG